MKNQEKVLLEVINRLNEIDCDNPKFKALKAFINENVYPEYLK